MLKLPTISSLQNVVSSKRPKHPIAPGGPFTQFRVLVLSPLLHVVEHLPQADQFSQNGQSRVMHEIDSLLGPMQLPSPTCRDTTSRPTVDQMKGNKNSWSGLLS